MIRSLVVLALLAGPAAAAEFEPLLAKLPADSNLICVVNTQKVFSSELGAAEQWKQSYQENFADSPLNMPPEAQKFVVGSKLDLASLTPVWEAAVATFEQDLPMNAVAILVKGEQDQVAGVDAVVDQAGSYILKLGVGEYGMLRPGSRQAAGRWAREVSDREEDALSPYLRKAASYPDRVGTEIILAIDLTDAVGQAPAAAAMGGSPVVADNKANPAKVAEELASLEGLTLGIRVTDRAYGSLRLDFARPIDDIEPMAKELLLEAMEEGGIAIDAFYDWELQATKTGFRISGELGRADIRKIFSLVSIDAAGIGAAAGGSAPDDAEETGEPRIDKYVTKEYFEGVQKYLRGLKLEKGAKSYYTIAHWFEKYAAAIDRLPILNVDPEMVDYAKRLVRQLRDAAYAIRGVGVRVGAQTAGVTGSAGTSSGGGSYSNARAYGFGPAYADGALYSGSMYEESRNAVRDASAKKRAVRQSEKAKGNQQVQAIVQTIRNENSDVRRRMTEKHQIEF